MIDRPLDRAPERVPVIDAVRGIAMLVMTLDHASGAFNRGRLMVDGASTFRADMVLEPVQFVTRWITHLCAPTFVLLAGISLALSVTRRRAARIASWQIDRDMLIRGALLIALDVVWLGWMWRLGWPLQLGVLYAIGVSIVALIALRRLPAAAVGALGVAILIAGEAITARLDPTTTLAAATLGGGQVGSVYYLYPFVPWMAMLLIGWAVGVRLAQRSDGLRARDWLALAALAAAVFVVVRAANGYGNAELYRRDGSWVEWLHVSKYPPSLSYAALELAIAFGLLAALARWRRPWPWLRLFGQTALFYYCVHAHLLKGVALVLGQYRTLGLGTTAIAWLATPIALYPACRWYLGLKQRHPESLLRFL